MAIRVDDVLIDDAATNIAMSGVSANLRMGGAGADGDVLLFRSDGDRTDDATATIHLDAQEANLRMGGSGADGDLFLFPSDGDRTDDATATIHLDGNSGDILLQNADCAEEFEIASWGDVRPGAVVVLTDDGHIQESTKPYDKRVMGVVSGAGSYRPGIVLDRQTTGGRRAPVAMVGKVYCKVDATFGMIEIGDLLSTSTTPGHAMKVTDASKAFGTVIGKALKPWADGAGLIPMLVSRH